MRTKKYLSDRPLTLLAAAAMGIVIFLNAPATYAGFQWVPPTNPQPAAAESAEVPPAAAVTTPEVEGIVLPLPGEEQSVPVPTATQLNAQDTVPVATPPQQPAPVALAPVPPARQTLQLPPDYQLQATLPPPGGPVLQVKTITPPAAEPVSLQPQAVSAPAPVATTKVIMPEDAPNTAVQSTPNSERLVIGPYPRKMNQAQPQSVQQVAAPAAAPAPSSFPTIEGFGSNMPLALALQQIVPADYAYAFGNNVNPGQTVSWDGGRPWDQIVNDMLAPHKLEAVIVGKVVHIRQEGLQQQSALSPAEVKRANINDPGQESQAQAANLASIESAAGEPAVTGQAVPAAAEEIALNIPAPSTEIPATEISPQAELASTDDASSHIVPITEINVEQQTQNPVTEIAPTDAAATPVPANGPWEAKAGESLKEILTRWSAEAGIELVWMASYDFKIKQDVAIDGTFPAAIETIVTNGIDAEITPGLQILQNPDGKAVPSIVIKDKTA